MAKLLAALLLLFHMLPAKVHADAMLLMAEEDGCPWCERWHDEIGHIYPKTAEGKTAPLTTYDIHDGLPAGIETESRVSFTPTFILLRDGIEVGRIEGYPGEDFFWGLLTMMFEQADIALDEIG